MYISSTLIIFFVFSIVLISVFIFWIAKTRQILLIHKFYFAAAICLIIWMLSLIGLRFTEQDNVMMQAFWDGTTTMCGSLIPPCSLLFAICYTKEYGNKLPKAYWLLFLIPAITTILVYTNQYHHLYYEVFSLRNTSVVFGPYFFVHSTYTFICVALSIIIILRFAVKTKTRLHILQAILFTIGSLIPSITNLLLLFHIIEANIVLTPISFVFTMIFHGIVIFRLHMFDIKPIAMQQLINWIGDCYLVTSPSGLVVNYNSQFVDLLGEQYKIRENTPLQNCMQNEDMENKTAIYNLLTALHSCQSSNSRVAYEQAISTRKKNGITKQYFMVEVTPLVMQNEICGFLSIFRDITQIKVNMQRLQDSQVKMMEQERLAFLGQMVGGLAHNLKTPIMSISGSTTAVEKLIDECEISLGDEDVTDNDYKEIYSEINGWLERMRDACAYMSDIINAVKGQAGNMNVSDKVEFSLDETFKRVSLLLRHELLNNHCTLNVNYDFSQQDILVNGDINNLVQIINNLVSNAIDAQIKNGNHDIIIDAKIIDDFLQITIKDFGTGIPEEIKKKLFLQMVTSKGTMGTGLGVFISNTVIHAKFDGSMWFDNNPEGGATWGIAIPMSNVTISSRKVISNEKE